MVRFAKLYPDYKIVSTLSQQLSWSHIIEVFPLKDDLQRSFYIQMSFTEKRSVRSMREKIRGMLYERTAISKNPSDVVSSTLVSVEKSGKVVPELVFKDPIFLDFLGLDTKYSESDLEQSIINHMVDFIKELGSDFCFVDRQKRMSTGNKDRYLDLLFFHRGMRRLVAIELKLGRFEPGHKGKMEWYLNWLDKHERRIGEEKPVGIILCADKDQGDVEYLELDSSGIHVAAYMRELPPKSLLEEKLHQAIILSKNQS